MQLPKSRPAKDHNETGLVNQEGGGQRVAAYYHGCREFDLAEWYSTRHRIQETIGSGIKMEHAATAKFDIPCPVQRDTSRIEGVEVPTKMGKRGISLTLRIHGTEVSCLRQVRRRCFPQGFSSPAG